MRKRNEKIGKPIFNLTIELELGPLFLPKNSLVSRIDLLEMYGLAVHYGKKLLRGDWRVTDKGYLIRFHDSELKETRIAGIDIEENMGSLPILKKIIDKEIEDNEMRPRVHFHYKEGRGLDYVGVKNNRMYLTSFQQSEEIRESIRKLKKEFGLRDKAVEWFCQNRIW